MEKIQTLIDSFIDYEGNEHKFMLAAVSVCEREGTYLEVYDEKDDDWSNEPFITKSVRLGYAICNPTDEWNEEFAYKMATGRARSNYDYALYATHPGMINTAVVGALLAQEAQYIMNNPGSVIPGYNEKREKIAKSIERDTAYNALTDDEKTTLKVLSTTDDETLDTITDLISCNYILSKKPDEKK